MKNTKPNKELSYNNKYYEKQPIENCPNCGKSYDEIDFEYQICSKCGWDAENKKNKNINI